MDKRKKLILIVIIISLSILIIVGGTTAFFGWRAEKEATVNVTIASGEGKCVLKRDNNLFIEPTSTKNGGRIIKLNASQSLGNKASITWNMNIKEIGGLQDASFRYEMINTSTGVSYGSGTFENITTGSTITFSNVEEALGFNLEYEFTLYLWIDGRVGYNQIPIADQALDFDISCNLVGTETGTVNIPSISGGTTAADYITDLYYDSNPELITQVNSGNEYYYAPSVNLMNDGLDLGNIRYYGKDPNNYVYFNCSNYNNPTSQTCELWRIIGVIDGKVKLVRADSIGLYSWDNTSNGKTNADWADSTLMSLLNNGYYNNSDDVVYYNNGSKTTINFDASGIGINTDTQKLISESTWYLGAWDKGDIYSDYVYNYERGYERCTTCGSETTWTGKIALPYASDYGFAADLSVCDQTMNNYNSVNCVGNNWLHSRNHSNSYVWLFTTNQQYANQAWAIYPEGHIITSGDTKTVSAVLPTLFLNAEVEFSDIGDGSIGNPYRIVSNKQTLVQHITYLYDSAKKSTVSNNNINYNYASSVSLMNDRLGNASIGANAGNIRYYGSNPNNYVDLGDVYETTTVDNFSRYASVFASFGVTTSDQCKSQLSNVITVAFLKTYFGGTEAYEAFLTSNFGTTDPDVICGEVSVELGSPKALYRIIGVFQDVQLPDGTKKDLIKVVRDIPVAMASWDQSNSTINKSMGINEWSVSDLVKILNDGYEDETVGGSLYWNNVDGGTCYAYNAINKSYGPLNCNFSVSGLSDKIKDKLIEVKWNTGGSKTNELYSNQIYQDERGTNVIKPGITCTSEYCTDTVIRTTTWTGMVALPYPSDFGYASDLSSCNYTLNNYGNCISENWLYQNLTLGAPEGAGWLLTSASNSASRVFSVYSTGILEDELAATNSRSVSPTFYLDADLIVTTGIGTKDEPYQIG